MFCRNISWLVSIFVALVVARTADHNVTDVTEESSTVEGGEEVKETSAVDLGSLLDAGDGAVVTLVAGDTRLAAHRAVLVARSPTFGAMIHHNSLDASSGVLSVPAVEGPVLRQLVAYLYTLQVPQLPDMAPQLLAAADRFGLWDLKAACEQQVAARLSVENAAGAALLALRHSCPSLRSAAVAFIRAHTHQVVMTQGWADALLGDPHSALQLTRLVAEPPQETSTAASTDIGSPRQPDTAAPTAPPTPPCHTVPADVSRFRRLSAEERGNRLIEAAQEGAVEELQALLAAGADVEARDGGKRTALHWAADHGQEEVARRLLEAGAEVEAWNEMDSTPLLWAAASGHAAVTRLLLSACADPNAKNALGKTPLHYAAADGYAEVAVALLEAGANACTRDNNDHTPRHLARQGNHQDLVDLLTKSMHTYRCLE